ncbi:conserved protein of unknown function [Streptomyces sp. KY75]|nr:conserved protein of unknown function [Streptomyces sp. KY75]CAD5984944.1 conserved protein of unknown function [Streptomyces sp. KY70]
MAVSQAVSFGVPLKVELPKYCAFQTGEAQVTAAEAGAAVTRPPVVASAAVAANADSRVRVITEKRPLPDRARS